MAAITQQWYEPLPDDCPPHDAHQPENETFYRLVEMTPPTEKDFWSKRKLKPQANLSENECINRAVSIQNDIQGCYDLQKLQRHSHKKIVKITLPHESGLVKKTGKEKWHFSWWRSINYEPLSSYELVE